MKNYDVTVIGSGPAGLAAAAEAHRNGAKVLLIEREARTGGILKQCIHDGFGLVRFGEKLSGPEYAERFSEETEALGIDTMLLTFVTEIRRIACGSFLVEVVNTDGVGSIVSKSVILATGCRERTAKQVAIHGTRPAGVFTAGTAQAFTNIYGQKVAGRCVILGSGDIGLIMARRLTLEGSEVIGVYEAKPTPSGLTRNIHQCLRDYDIPLYLSHTVTRTFGDDRLTAVEISEVDEKMRPVPGTEQIVECDALILSVGLIPENELAESIGVAINPRTKGPYVDENLETTVKNVYSCGNALHVNDLVDYVSESGETAGRSAAKGLSSEKRREITGLAKMAYIVPSHISENCREKVTFYFRSADVYENAVLTFKAGGKELLRKKFAFLRPPEMERFEIDFADAVIGENTEISVDIE